ncbi:hypothetical protein ACK32Z_09520 [Aeromonas hydrophila]|uniref:phosphorylase family protein n=1 Tax=Aeromonas hydrophila TaxID=644 RepID=UPI0039879C8A
MTNIIIVDDCDRKIEAIKLAFPSNSNTHIDIAKCSAEAQEYFSEKVYDFAIIDLALPKRKNESPRNDEGLDLIRSIYSFDWFKKPKKAIAITQHVDLADKYIDEFQELGVVLYNYDGTNAISETIASQYEIINKTNKQIDYDFDALIITALDEEAKPFLKMNELEWSDYDCYAMSDTPIKVTNLSLEGNTKKIGLIILPRMGLICSAITTTKSTINLRPKLVMMSGICAGVEDEVKLGDIIIANPVWEWQTGKWKGNNFSFEPYQISIPPRVINAAKRADLDSLLLKTWNHLEHNKPLSPPNVFFGPLVSGSSVISNEQMINELKEQHRKLLGLEMEIFGMYAACSSAPLTTDFIGIKSVCDYGNEEKADDFHHFCAEIAATATLEIMKSYFQKNI